MCVADKKLVRSQSKMTFYYYGIILFAAISTWTVACKSKNNIIQNEKEQQEFYFADTSKQRGAHLFRYRDTSRLSFLDEMKIDWVTLVPWGYMDDCKDPTIRHTWRDRTQAEGDSLWLRRIKVISDKGYKVFLKPHIWLRDPAPGKWRSDIYPKDDTDWETWKENYREFILRYARVAEAAQVDMFCVGTELTKLSAKKPTFWRQIISEIKEIYSGKLTYAANWYKEYEAVTFWDELDYIGIQAYFPLVKKEEPTVEEVKKGWDKHLPKIRGKSKEFNKQILFTEMGYKSTRDSAIKPWEWMEHENNTKVFSLETQANCYQAFFDVFWNENWFSGVHIWQLRGNHRYNSDYDNLDFTPQGKLAVGVITKGFGR